MSNKKAIVVGAGIVGLATARALAVKGYSVTVIERNDKTVGASIRNFGMLWPVGQPDGKLYNRAIRSRNIWKEIADATGIWYEEAGSLHVARHADEWEVLQELQENFSAAGRQVKLMDKNTISKKFNYVNTNGLLGGLYSATEMIIDPRQAIAKLPLYLNEQHQVVFIWGKAVTNADARKETVSACCSPSPVCFMVTPSAFFVKAEMCLAITWFTAVALYPLVVKILDLSVINLF